MTRKFVRSMFSLDPDTNNIINIESNKLKVSRSQLIKNLVWNHKIRREILETNLLKLKIKYGEN